MEAYTVSYEKIGRETNKKEEDNSQEKIMQVEDNKEEQWDQTTEEVMSLTTKTDLTVFEGPVNGKTT